MKSAMKYIRKVLACLRKADETFSLISAKDRILVGVSGGKDSLALLHALSIYRKFAQKDFKIVPVCLDLGFPGFDATSMRSYASSLGLDLKVEDSQEVYPILKAHTKDGGHLPCSICSRMKKAAVNAAAKKYRCNKVAFAHHQDDALETLFMNMVHGGKVATFEPEMRLSRAGVTFIRPFIFVSEDDIKGMVKEENIPVLGKICPADGATEREMVKQGLRHLYELRPEAKTNFASTLTNYEPFLLYFDRLYYSLPGKEGYSLKPAVMASSVIAYSKVAKRHKELTPVSEEGTTFFFCVDKKMVGRITFVFRDRHVVDILALESYLPKEETLIFFQGMMDRLLAATNPLYYIYSAKGKALAKASGFALRTVPGYMDKLGLYRTK